MNPHLMQLTGWGSKGYGGWLGAKAMQGVIACEQLLVVSLLLF